MSARESIVDYAPHAARLVPKSSDKVVYRSVFEFEGEARTRRVKRLFGALRRLKAAKVVDRSLEAWAVRWTRDALVELIGSLPVQDRNAGTVSRKHGGAVKAAKKHGGWAALVLEVTGSSPRRIHEDNGSLILVVDRQRASSRGGAARATSTNIRRIKLRTVKRRATLDRR